MSRKWLTIGTCVYLLLTLAIVPLFFHIPLPLFTSDDASYSGAAIRLLEHGFLSLDGVRPFLDREPGQSVLLAMTYALFGIENPIGVFVVQGTLLFIATLWFCSEICCFLGQRIASIAFVMILTSGSVLHVVFSAYREGLALVLLLYFVTIWMKNRRCATHRRAMLMGIILGCTILTYYSFVLLPLVLIPLMVIESQSRRSIALMLAGAYGIVALWGIRNALYDGQFRILENQRAEAMWYVRGEQAETIHGLEPFRCLWSEYVSRDWTHRPPNCSFNSVKNRRWPSGIEHDPAIEDAGSAGKRKIMEHPIAYLWFSIVDVIELHLPYVGGGWSTKFNTYAAITQLLLAFGCLRALPSMMDQQTWIFWLIAIYNTGIFSLTDATPRYLLPVFFCYAVIAAIGYDRLLRNSNL